MARDHMGQRVYGSKAAWKRALVRDWGDRVVFTTHEGTADAWLDRVGHLQLGDWDDTVGTVYETRKPNGA